MSCSRTGTSMCSRCGQVADGDLLAAVAALEPADDRAVEHVDVVLDDDHVAAFGDSDTTSPLRTRKLAMSTRLPLTRIRPWLTNWRACGRVDAQPARYMTLSRRCLEQAQQVLARRALQAVGLFVGAAELALEHAVDVLRLLLLLQLGEVLAAGVAAAGAAVRAGREGPTLERLAALLVLEDVGAEAAGDGAPWDRCSEP